MKFSNVVILLLVLLAHYSLLNGLLSHASSPPTSVPIAGTTLEISFVTLAQDADPETPTELPEEKAEITEQNIIALDQDKHNDDFKVHNSLAQTAPTLEQPTEPKQPTLKAAQPKTELPKSHKRSQPKKTTPLKRTQGNQPSNANPSSKNGIKGQSGAAKDFTPPSHQGATLGNRKPKYPELSLRKKEEGQVLLKVRVSPQGRAESVSIHKSSGHHRLDNAAKKAAEKYHYRPANKNGTAVAYDYLFTITFSIQNP